MPSSTGSGEGFVPCDVVSHLGVTPTVVAGARPHYSPCSHNYTLLTGGDGYSVVAVVGLAAVLSVVGGGSNPSPAALDGCPLGLLLLAVVQVAVLVAVLAVVQVAMLPMVGGGSSSSPAASDGCPLRMLLLAVVLLVVVQVAVLVVVQVAGGGSNPSPEASDG
ncbi:hypothetical protein NDU88_007447 [Pleurodeles waltl]|uniref:Uncharacterized protein n=1 Tax=Pleurodeles waltl TaxID=8319 RepID=A0AAV7N439_PLEWA|nr:hypothetical protein NDU88_007447 [Pleurodeles waltl]